jgi:hypothetical protein
MMGLRRSGGGDEQKSPVALRLDTGQIEQVVKKIFCSQRRIEPEKSMCHYAIVLLLVLDS